ncbi:hypothetical protein CIG75_20265 [Tumebacillus algifaecis]|uniref:DUF3139 domain-containing protein n=1 Tax=Tumebacillus algifaecis TaxID=1214604 RepID=A0A223D626_9BACL|nr:hypothetical protein [Tumebacillus algifaecis]ASS77005.1 hypothetical protein CIG75_20265 [Tumebacillus algifaecis]
MAKRKYLLLAVLLVLLQFTPIMQQAEVRLTATVYMVVKHHDKQLEYKGMEFDPHFGEYMVTYQNENGQNVSLSIRSKHFPFAIIYDPLDQPMQEEVFSNKGGSQP